MTTGTRRQFLQATTLGLAAGALSREPALDARQAAGAAPAGANIIDCHAHWVGPTVVDLLKTRTSPRPPQGAGWTDIDARLREMDKTGVRRQVLAWVGASFDGALPPADARPLWRAQNDDVAAVVKKHPARFSGLASLPTANVAWAADELERAHTDLGLIGAVLPLDAFVSLAGARALAPIFEAAQKHRSHIFVHRGAAGPDIPGQQPETGAVNPYFGLGDAGGRGGGPGRGPAASTGDYAQARTLLATATHLATGVITLALTDFLDAYPDVTVQVAMMGGAIAYVAENIQMAAEEAGTPVPARRFKSVYLDTGQSGRGPRGIAMAVKVFGADRLLFGTDSGPTTSIGPTIESVTQAALTADEKALIFSGNGRRLLAAKGVTV
ncbi:MAG: amidohydrolase [Acidobacteriia bacterium]|nr:amidohydrolase [Terriglobia bacterium]